MKQERDIPFAFDAADFKRALEDVAESIAKRKGKILRIRADKAGGHDIGVIVVEETL